MFRLKKTILSLVLVLATVLTLSAPAFAAETATVTDDCVRVHTTPDMDSEIYTQVNKGDKLKVVKAADEYGWTKVEFVYQETGETMTGYISNDFLKYSDSKEQASDSSTKEETKKESEEETTAEAKEETKKEDEEEETASISSAVSYTATVAASGVRIREKPNTKAEILTSVPEESIVTILSAEDENGWMKVKYYDENGKKFKGYMSGEYLDINSIGSGVSTVTGAILRADADKASAISGVIPKDKKVDIYASKDNWYKVEYQDLSGWVHSSCIKTEGESDCEGYCKVKTNDLNLRSKPSKNGDVLAQIPKGVMLQITKIRRSGQWYQVTYNGRTGYISAKYAKRMDSCTSGYVQVTASSLTLRSGAGASYARLATIPTGKVLKVSGSVGSWYEVKYRKFTGYVSGAFVSATTKDGFQSYPDFAEVLASTLTLRADSDIDSEALDSIPEGAIVAITGIDNGWYRVTYNGQTGYIDSDYASRSTEAAAEAYEAVANVAQSESNESSSSGSGSGGSILSYASQFIGNPYSWGGTSLTGGADCSGFVKSVLAHFGISVPHSSASIRGYGKSVSVSDMQPGDVVCYDGHVGIYAGDGKLLSALGKKYGITYNSVHYKKILSVRRFS